MRSLFYVALLSSFSLAAQVGIQKRQATDGAQFTAAANQLISSYINPGALAPLAPAIQSAASAASVTYSDIQSLVYSALEADPVPAWFTSAIPSAYQANINALESGISALRGAAVVHPTVVVPVVLAITTTDSAGSTFTTSLTTSATGAVTTATSTVSSGTATTSTTASPQTTSFTTITNSDGSVVTSGILEGVNGASSVGSQAVSGASSVGTAAITGVNSVGSVAVSGASSVGSVAVSGASSVGSQIASGATSVINAASSFFAPPTTTGPANAASTSSSGGAAASAGAGLGGIVLGAVGLVLAL